jgi:hypothetical protein
MFGFHPPGRDMRDGAVDMLKTALLPPKGPVREVTRKDGRTYTVRAFPFGQAPGGPRTFVYVYASSTGLVRVIADAGVPVEGTDLLAVWAIFCTVVVGAPATVAVSASTRGTCTLLLKREVCPVRHDEVAGCHAAQPGTRPARQVEDNGNEDQKDQDREEDHDQDEYGHDEDQDEEDEEQGELDHAAACALFVDGLVKLASSDGAGGGGEHEVFLVRDAVDKARGERAAHAEAEDQEEEEEEEEEDEEEEEEEEDEESDGDLAELAIHTARAWFRKRATARLAKWRAM